MEEGQEGEADQAPTLPDHLLAALSATMGEEVVEADLVGVPQWQLGAKVDDRQRRLLEEGVGEEEMEVRARLQSLTLPHAGDWLHAAPILALGLHLQPLEFVLAASYRLGLPLYRVEGASPTCPACHQPADIYGIHTMNCGTGGERIHRHTLLVDVVHQVAAAAQLAPRKEVRFLIPGRDSRPADVLLPQWSGGQDAALDITVVNPCQAAFVVGAAATPGYALEQAHRRKMRGAEEACRAQGLNFLPLVAESHGGWGEVAVAVVDRIARSLARQTGQREEDVTRQTWSRLAVTLQRANGQTLYFHVLPPYTMDL